MVLGYHVKAYYLVGINSVPLKDRNGPPSSGSQQPLPQLGTYRTSLPQQLSSARLGTLARTWPKYSTGTLTIIHSDFGLFYCMEPCADYDGT